ncbi:MAG: pyridoxal phosphate-dependent aminotransferase [Myxococcales bacterium]|nr:pyridoxal phosphate-dependent aminotransferase [Myxococcales bacterium]
MPRFPEHSPDADSLSDRVFGAAAPSAGRPPEPVYRLNVGDTYLQPLPAARAEAQLAAEHPQLHGYSPVQGEPVLLDAIAKKIERRSGIRIERPQLQVMSGATSGLGVVVTALLSPGDEVIVPSPFWPLIRGIVRFHGALPVQVPIFHRLHEPGFDPIAALEAAITPRTAAIYVNCPNNPTGQILSDAQLQAIGELAERHQLWVLCDEVYEDLWLGEQAPPPSFSHAALRERAVATHSVSKAYGLAGARVGYSHGPEAAMEPIRNVQTFFTYCAARPMQLGAARALSEGDSWLDDARARYRKAAASVAEGLGLPMPEGGSFCFFDARPHVGKDVAAGGAAAEFLARAAAVGVMLTPGLSSGEDFGDWVRLCFTCIPQPELEAAIDRLQPLMRGGDR